MATFCVVLITNDGKAVVDRFIDHYVGLGADRIAVFFDSAPDFEIDDYDGRVETTVCDDEFWESIAGERPDVFNIRQRALYSFVLSCRSEDWIFFVDSDEFLVSSRRMAQILDEVPEDLHILRIKNVEAVWGPGDDRNAPLGARWFRSPIRSSLRNWIVLKLLYGRVEYFMKDGLLGHANGKHFARPGKKYDRTNAHTSFYPDGRQGVWLDTIIDEDVKIHHFDAQNFGLWSSKFVHRSENQAFYEHIRKERQELFRLALDTSKRGSGPMRKLFDRLYCISPWQAFLLRKLGLAARRDIFN